MFCVAIGINQSIYGHSSGIQRIICKMNAHQAIKHTLLMLCKISISSTETLFDVNRDV